MVFVNVSEMRVERTNFEVFIIIIDFNFQPEKYHAVSKLTR